MGFVEKGVISKFAVPIASNSAMRRAGPLTGRTIIRVDRMNPAFSTHLRRKPA
jgi:hypothetical protein